MSDYLDDIDDEKCIEFIKNYLPQDQKNLFTDDQLYYFMDVIDDYYVESGVLEAKPDAQGYVSIDLDAVTDYAVKEAKKDGIGEFTHDDVFFIVQGEMEYSDTFDDDNK